MNYLAHIFLSGDEPGWMVGGFLGDFVKGPLPATADDPVTMGIKLHRQIDLFVDQQPEVKDAVNLIQPPFRRYGGILVDMMFDHFLADQWQSFHGESLESYCTQFYGHLNNHYQQLPHLARYFADVAPKVSWLEGYAELDNMPKYLQGISRRIRRPIALDEALPTLRLEYNQLLDAFHSVFPRVIAFSHSQINQIHTDTYADTQQSNP